jgi:hypothetical protein
MFTMTRPVLLAADEGIVTGAGVGPVAFGTGPGVCPALTAEPNSDLKEFEGREVSSLGGGCCW